MKHCCNPSAEVAPGVRQIGTAAIQMGIARMGLDQAGQHCRRLQTNWTVSTCSSHSQRNRRRSMTERIDVLHRCKGASRASQVTEAWWRDRCRTSEMAMASPYLKLSQAAGYRLRYRLALQAVLSHGCGWESTPPQLQMHLSNWIS